MSEARLKRNPFGNPAEGVEGGIRVPIVTPSPGSSPLKVPYVDPALIDYLRSVYPVQVHQDFDLRFYDRQVGIKKVIDHLQGLHDQQQG